MSEKLTYTLKFQVTSGPTIQESDTLTLEAYDKTQVAITAGDADTEVNIQPSGSGLAQVIVVTSSEYEASLTYKVNADTADPVALDGPHILIGTGAVGLLDTDPTKLFFTNGLSDDVEVTVLVGRERDTIAVL